MKSDNESLEPTSDFLIENSVEKHALLPQNEFLKKYRISPESFELTKISWNTLQDIHKHYLGSQEFLQNTINTVVAKFLTNEAKEAGVHSVRSRLKSPDGLIEKIIRKTIETVKKGELLNITLNNYNNEITDLIGVRVLHVFKDDWLGIHDFILNSCHYKTINKPLVYYRKGDDKSYIDVCKKNGCEAKTHPKAYRSIHYIIDIYPNQSLYFAEIQVRTVFEDGWSEIDHKLRYHLKTRTKNPLDRYLLALNRIAGSADEIAAIIKNRQIELRQEEYERLVRQETRKKN